MSPTHPGASRESEVADIGRMARIIPTVVNVTSSTCRSGFDYKQVPPHSIPRSLRSGLHSSVVYHGFWIRRSDESPNSRFATIIVAPLAADLDRATLRLTAVSAWPRPAFVSALLCRFPQPNSALCCTMTSITPLSYGARTGLPQ